MGIALRAGIMLGLLLGPLAARAAEYVNIYTTRQEVLIRPLLDAFEKATGITPATVFAKEGVIERLKSEAGNSPADVILTADVGNLIQAEAADLLQPVKSAVLEAAIPPQYRDAEGRWFGLALRARPIMYAKDRVDPAQLSTYEDLADPKWKGRICVRSSSNIYNQSMVAAMIAERGVAPVEQWVKGLVANFAREPTGGDRDQILAVAAGECDIALANTYYLAGMLKSEEGDTVEAAKKVGVFWPNQKDRGVHVNVSGGGVVKSAPHPQNAVKLLEFLVSDEAQELYAHAVNEYPVKAGIAPDAVVAGFGNFKADELPLHEIGDYNAEAVKLMDRAGWR